MLKHGFLIIAHEHLELLDKIIELLSCPNHYFFINIDRKSSNDYDIIRKYENDEYFRRVILELKHGRTDYANLLPMTIGLRRY